MAVLKEKEQIGKYKVQNIIKANHYTETYRVEDADHNAFFLKLFVLNRIPSKLVNPETHCVKEIEYSKQISDRNIVSFIAGGSLEKEEGSLQYYITDYFQGSLLADKIQVNGAMPEEDALVIFQQVLSGLQYLHTQSPALCHNDLDPSNIVIQETTSNDAVLIDLGHLSTVCNGVTWFDMNDMNLLYHAKETMVGIFDQSGDLFSACAILYAMLTGKAPWNEAPISADGTYKERFKELWQYRKTHHLNIDEIQASNKVKYILQKGLADKAADRFANVEEILEVLNKDEKTENISEPSSQQTAYRPKKDDSNDERSDDPNQISIDVKRGGGNGFKDIAGMQELKDYLQQKVIFVIKNKDIAKKYRLTPPNGMLLYGPPGCGKTYFAEKFAEETGFNFMLVKSSDVGSSLVHGTQEKVKKLFKKAEKNSPIVLCFDEFDAIVPDRGAHGNEYVASEVNEYLSQLNNCAKRGIFVVATSNRPDKIDPAILRTGRIDKQVFVPLPDFEARKEMFKMYLNNRPTTEDVDIDALAKATEGYIASDIAFIVNDAAMTAAFAREPISNNLMKTTVQNIRPSLRKETIEEYSVIKDKMNGIARRAVVEGLQ